MADNSVTTFVNDVSLNSGLSVGGDASLNANVDICGHLNVNNDVSLNIIISNTPQVNVINGNLIDFSNNQNKLSDSYFEIYGNIDCSFSTDPNKSQGLELLLVDQSGNENDIKIDIRSIANSSTTDVLGFGPRNLIFDSGNFPDDKYKNRQYRITLRQTGDADSTININYPVRFVMKQKSLV